MFERHHQAVLELFRNRKLVPPDRLASLEARHESTGRSLADLAIESGEFDSGRLLREIADTFGCGYTDALPKVVPDETVALVPRELACRHGVVPMRIRDRAIDLLIADPFEPGTAEDVAFSLGREVRLIVGDPIGVQELVRRCYGGPDESAVESVPAPEKPSVSATETDPSVDDLQTMADQAPVIRFVNLVLAQAIRDHASDIHFEPFENEFKIRYRIDGALYEMTPPPLALALPVISRVKVLANLDIAERRLPQDGRIRLVVADQPVDLRVSTLPTQFGESVVLRVLDRSNVKLDIRQLGLPDDVLDGVREMVRRPNGIFIVTGPTGSGKTTTLYSSLQLINTPDLKVLTAEDPVEYELEGVMQVPVNPAAGLTFASALRSFLRQDPDVIMVGEIRDLETAQIAIQASLTGHLVLSTLHTNDAAGAVTRLIDMGVEPFLLAATLEGVLAQRLVRKICPRCRTSRPVTAQESAELGIGESDRARFECFHGVGCPDCAHTGYRGRMGIYEWLPMGDEIRELIDKRAPSFAVREKARERGMRTLREDGRRAILSGATTVEEILKYT